MNRDSKTLVILTPGFAASETDTACLPMQQNFVRTLKENHPAIDIIVLSFQYPFERKEYSWFAVPVISFGGKNRGGFARLLLRRKILTKLKELHRKKKITGILSFWYNECAWIGKEFAAKNDIKHYCWLLGQDARAGNRYIKYVKLKAGELIALSDFLQDEFERNYGTRPQYMIPPGVTTTHLNAPAKEKDVDIIAAGSLIPLKQYDVFIEVIEAVKKEIPGVKAVLVGNGPQKERLQSLIIKKQLTQNITLTGELPHAEVLQWMQRGRIFLHPSSYEGFGVVCLEALQAGCHVISFCRPMKQNIEHWYIVNSKEAMKQKTLEVLQEKHTVHTPSIPFLITDTVKAVADLFISSV